jgi:hypothetical protein
MIRTSQLASHTHLSQDVGGTSKQSPERQTMTSPDTHAPRNDKTQSLSLFRWFGHVSCSSDGLW